MNPSRPLPQPDGDTAFFWEAALRGELRILRCDDCGTFIHPPRGACRSCGGASVTPAVVSGRGTVHTFTVTHRPLPGFEAPFAVVLVDLDDAPGVRLVSNLIDVAPAEIEIGMRVEVVFERAGEAMLPLFRRRRT